MRVFLSFHSPDRECALALKAAIEQAQPGSEVFVDQTGLRYGHLWQPALFDAIAKSTAFIILVSNQLGDWQKVEYYEARDRKAKDDNYLLLPIIVADKTKGPAANLPGLAQLHWIETTEPAAPEPLSRIVAALSSKAVPKPPEPWRIINPYRGLLALEEQDADFFFGRDLETAGVLEAVINKPGRLIALIGNSGVGKSSLVQAGVIGSLKRQRWPGRDQIWPPALRDSRSWAFLSMRPGEDPVEALASTFASLWFADVTDPDRIARRRKWAAMLKDGRAKLSDLIETTDARLKTELGLAPPPRFLLYIDQGEELYSRAPKDQIKNFSELIAHGLSEPRLVVMSSQRSDFYGQLQANEALFPLSERIDVPPLGAEALKAVLREPARVLGVKLESDDLIEQIVGSAEDQPGALPLLADLFTDLWERMQARGDGTLRVTDRREIIQVGAALSRRADEFVAQHPAQVEDVKRLFTLRLAHVPRMGEPVRRQMVRTPEREEEWKLAQTLAGPEWRLLVTGENDRGEATAEVAHEVLFKTWANLKQWLEREHDFLVWRDDLEARLQEYQKLEKASSSQKREALLMGLPLTQAEQWLKARGADIDPPEQRFIEESRQRDSGRKRNLRVAAIVAFVVVAAFAAFAALNWINARDAKNEATRSLKTAEAARDEAREATNKVTKTAEQEAKTSSLYRAEQSAKALDHGDAVTAMLLALDGMPDKDADEAFQRTRPYVPETEDALYSAWQVHRERAILVGHIGEIKLAVFSPDGRRVVTASLDGTARVWDAESGKPLATLAGHTNWVYSAAFSPDGRHVVTASRDKTARVWDAESGKPLATLAGHTGPVYSAAFSPDGRRVVTASMDGTARVWDAESGTPLATLAGHTDLVIRAEFSPDGIRIVTASHDKTALIWDAESGKPLATLAGHSGRVNRATFSPDGRRVVTSSQDDTARLWDAKSGKALATLAGHTIMVTRAAFSPDGRRVVTASLDNTARVWDAESGKPLATLAGHTSFLNDAAFSPDSRRIVTASDDNTARVWDAESGKPLVTLAGHTGPVYSAAFSPDGRHVVTASADDTARIWDTESRKPLATLGGHTERVTSAAFSPDGRRVVTASADYTAEVWDAESGKLLATLVGHTGSVDRAAFSPDGRRVVTASWDNTARVWDAESGKPLATLAGHTSFLNDAAFSPDSRRIVTASHDNTARVWDAESGKPLVTLAGHTDAVGIAVFSLDGRRVITASYGTARVWDVEGGQPLATLADLLGIVAFSPDGRRVVTESSVAVKVWDIESGKLIATGPQEHTILFRHRAAFSSDGRRFVITSDDQTARVWDAESGKRLVTLAGHTSRVNSAAFSPNGRRVVTASTDGTARVWDAESGKLLATLVGHTGSVDSAAFSPDGRRVITASEDGTARVWSVFSTAQPLIDQVKVSVDRCLTSVQREQFHLSPSALQWCIKHEKWPHDPTSLVISAASSLKAGNPTGAVAAFDEAIRLERLPGRDAWTLGAALLGRALAYEHAGNKVGAAADFDEAASLGQNVASVFVQRGNDLLKDKNYNDASAAFDEAVRRARLLPQDHWTLGAALLGRALAYEHAGNKVGAAADFDEAASLGQNVASVFVQRGNDLLKDKNYNDASAAFDEAVRRARLLPQDHWTLSAALLARAQVYERVGNKVGAAADFDEAASLGQNVASVFVQRGNDLLKDKNYNDASAAFDEAVRRARLLPQDHWTLSAALLARAQVYERVGNKVGAAADFDEAASLGENVASVFVQRGNDFFKDKKYEDAFAAFDEAVRWAERPDAEPETRGELIFGRGRAEYAKEQYEDAIRDFQTATKIGVRNANDWRWWATNQRATQLNDRLPIDALLISLPNYLDLTPELRRTIGSDDLKSELASVYAPLGVLSTSLLKEPETNAQPTDCDHLASHPYDPLRVTDGVVFDKLDAASVIAACTAAIGSTAAPSRYYFERARGHTKAAADAHKESDEAQRAQHGATALADLRIAAEQGYPIAFNNLASAYQDGEGVEKDKHKAADFYLETFNRILACCAVRVAQHILEVDYQHDPPTVRRVVRALLERAAALGVPQAHDMLGDFYETGKPALVAPVTEAPIEAYFRRKLAATLFLENGSSQDANRLEGRADEVRARLTASQMQAADARIAKWKRESFDSSPPWLSGAGNN